MLSAGGRAPPLGDFINSAPASNADAGAGVQCANRVARGGRALGHAITVIIPITSAQTTSQHRPEQASPKSAVRGCIGPNAG